MAHATLVRPALVASCASFSSPLTPPLGLAYLAGSLVASGHEATIIDAIAEGIGTSATRGGYRYEGLGVAQTVDRIPRGTDAIGVSCMFSQDWLYSREVIRAIRGRFPETPILLGGEHVTALPELVLQDCPEADVCVLGEAEETCSELLSSLGSEQGLSRVAGIARRRGGRVLRSPPRPRIRDVDSIPPPAWHLLPMETYLDARNAHGVFRGRSMPILATRGCPYECTFCSSPSMYGTQWLARRPGLVLDEIKGYLDRYGAENIDFYDLTMIIRKDWVLEFCGLIERRGLRFTWQLPTGTRSEVIDAEVSDALYRTGCRNVTYAPESGSEDTLRRIKKKVRLDRVRLSIASALSSGLSVKCGLIVGFPHETRRHVLETLLFAWRLAWLGVHDVGLFIFSPYPGSELFRGIREERFPDGLDDDYFRSLAVFMDMTRTSAYCKNLGPRELSFWRFLGMALFYALSWGLRPWRLARLVRDVLSDRSETVLAQRGGAFLRRRLGRLGELLRPRALGGSSA